MKRNLLVLTVAIAVCLVPATWANRSRAKISLPPENAFVPDCSPPFPAASPRPVDVSCGSEGTFVDNDTAAHRAQNRAKNSFCAKGSGGTVATDPIPLTISLFDTLQANVVANGIQFGNSANLPANRNALKDIATTATGASIGEGSYVVFEGFMLDAHPTSKESVSCQNGTVGFIDIHISIARSKNANLCRSIGAEISPHFRPTLWVQIYYAKHYQELLRHPLRLKGQLFFDGSHHPCGDPNMTTFDPLRRSDWEIHPVYAIDVCAKTTLSGCGLTDNAVWTSFDQWIVSQ